MSNKIRNNPVFCLLILYQRCILFKTADVETQNKFGSTEEIGIIKGATQNTKCYITFFL